MTFVLLLDAGRVGGEPVAFVSEHSGGMPSDTFEELVRVRLRDGARTVLVRRTSWESGHSRTRLLDGGDFLAVAYAEASAALERWRPSATKPQWTVPLGSDDGRTIFAAFSSTGTGVATVERRSGTALVVTDYDAATGKPGPSRTVTVKDATALSCAEWLTATDLLCARTDATPVALAVTNGSLREVWPEVGATATVVR